MSPVVIVQMSQLRSVERSRPPGYVEDVLSQGNPLKGTDGEVFAVALSREAYDQLKAKYSKHRPPRPQGGPGTELKAMLSGWPLYIKTTPSCSCNKRAQLMDVNEAAEPGWCRKNMDTIVGWLQEEHAARKIRIPFFRPAVRLLVRKAIRRANSK